MNSKYQVSTLADYEARLTDIKSKRGVVLTTQFYGEAGGVFSVNGLNCGCYEGKLVVQTPDGLNAWMSWDDLHTAHVVITAQVH